MDIFEFFITLLIAWHVLMGLGMAFAAVVYTVWRIFIRAPLRHRYVMTGKEWWKW